MEVQCEGCEWEGHWEDAERTVENSYLDYFGTRIARAEYNYLCPLCGVELVEADSEPGSSQEPN